MSVTLGNQVEWLGHAAVRITSTEGTIVLIDPWLDGNPACPPEHAKVGACDIVLLTHGHSDHVGSAVPIAKSTGATVVAIVELAGWIASKGIETVVGMNKGGTVTVKGVAVTMVHAHHSSSVSDEGHTVYAGEAAGFVVRLENGYCIYHAGDTSVFGDMALIGQLYSPDLAVLPVGDHFTMSPIEASKAIRLLGVRHVMPMHYGTFPILNGTPQRLRELTRDIDGLRIHSLEPGQSVT